MKKTMPKDPRCPPEFFCSLSDEIMQYPVTICATGETYERRFITQHLATTLTCPNSGEVLLEPPLLIPNCLLKLLIEDWSKKHRPKSRSVEKMSKDPPCPPDEFYCILSNEIMRDPVVINSTGETYERKFIEEHLKTNLTCPKSGKVLTTPKLIPHLLVKRLIQDWSNKHCPKSHSVEKKELVAAGSGAAGSDAAGSDVFRDQMLVVFERVIQGEEEIAVAVSGVFRDQMRVFFERVIRGEELLGLSLRGRFFEVCEGMRQRDNLIVEIKAVGNRLLVAEAVLYLRKIQGQEMDRLERLRTMLAQSNTRLFRERRYLSRI